MKLKISKKEKNGKNAPKGEKFPKSRKMVGKISKKMVGKIHKIFERNGGKYRNKKFPDWKKNDRNFFEK